MTPEDNLRVDPPVPDRATEEASATLRRVIAAQQAEIDFIEERLRADVRDEVKMALAAQCRRLRLVCNELAGRLDELRPPSPEMLLTIKRTERAVSSLVPLLLGSGRTPGT